MTLSVINPDFSKCVTKLKFYQAVWVLSTHSHVIGNDFSKESTEKFQLIKTLRLPLLPTPWHKCQSCLSIYLPIQLKTEKCHERGQKMFMSTGLAGNIVVTLSNCVFHFAWQMMTFIFGTINKYEEFMALYRAPADLFCSGINSQTNSQEEWLARWVSSTCLLIN